METAADVVIWCVFVLVGIVGTVASWWLAFDQYRRSRGRARSIAAALAMATGIFMVSAAGAWIVLGPLRLARRASNPGLAA
jgi:cytochrome bd-type quinol oxidase subunit 2